MSNNKKSNKITALLIIVAMVSSFLMGGSLSRFLTEVNSNSSSRVAIWGINDGEVEMELFNSKYDLDADNVLAQSHNGDNIIAPGLGDTSPFNIIKYDNIAPEVAYELKITVDDTEVDELIKNNPSIQWKLDDNQFSDWETFKTSLLNLSGDPSGYKLYAPGEFAPAFQNNQEHTISWQWVMDNNNTEMDTLLGNTAAERDVIAKIKVNITAEQFDGQSSGMLEGNGQTVNVNDIQPLTFRSLAPYNEFQNVTVNGETLTKNTDYTVTSGSTIVTLNKSYLEDLDLGTYDISIVSDNMTATTKFYVKDGPIVHNGIIPEGGVYYVETIIDNTEVKDYYGAKAILTGGQEFPAEVNTGDAYVFGDYEYRFNSSFEASWVIGENNGWGVRVLDTSKTEYGKILNNINGKDVVSLAGAFGGCTSLVNAPVIPNSVTNMYLTFENCTSLVNAPVIPNSVNNMAYTFQGCTSLKEAPVIPDSVIYIDAIFRGCSSLTGTIEVNANPIYYSDVFAYTQKSIILTGSSDLLEEIAATATNGNVKVANYNDGTNQLYVSEILFENSWDTISKVTKAGKALDYWSVGDKTTVDINGTDYEVAIADFNHDGENTVTFVFIEDVTTAPMNSDGYNQGSWKDSDMRNITIDNILNQMENKDLIKEVEKKTIKGYYDACSLWNEEYGYCETIDSEKAYELVTTNDKLFLLSYNEVFGKQYNEDWENLNEGTQYEYFKTVSNRIIEPKEDGYGVFWWLRTPFILNEYEFFTVDRDGSNDIVYADREISMVLAFVIG